jgi:LmbE family N-acetylglucosaminyl deacetylase
MDQSFETAEPGTSETTWLPALEHAPEWMPQSKSLTVVSPHPDDETLGAGGLIYTCAELGYDITIILVTDGENARPEIDNLAKRRCDELLGAMKRLAPDGSRVVHLHLPDGEVASFQGLLVQRLLRAVPLDSTLVAPFERDGHTDHAATSAACREVARQLDIPCVQYPIWAWHRLQPPDLETGRVRRVPLSSAARQAKADAIECYGSQTEPRPGGAVVPPHVLTYFQRPFEVFLV